MEVAPNLAEVVRTGSVAVAAGPVAVAAGPVNWREPQNL